MNRPKQNKPKTSGFIGRMTPDVLPDPQLDPIAFEEFIRNRGIKFKLEKSSYCPNLTDIDARNHDPNCPYCYNGLIYYTSCEVYGIFQQNKLERMYEIAGSWDVGEAVVTFVAYNKGQDGTIGTGKPIDVQPFDRVTAVDYEFRHTQLVEHSPTGIDRLRYPALSVEFLSTPTTKYEIGTHFVINDKGYIQWLSSNQPKYDQMIHRGEIFTISYTARPTFIIVNIIHEGRWTNGYDPLTGEHKAVMLPQMALIRRAHLFFNDNTHLPFAPRDGGNVTPA